MLNGRALLLIALKYAFYLLLEPVAEFLWLKNLKTVGVGEKLAEEVGGGTDVE